MGSITQVGGVLHGMGEYYTGWGSITWDGGVLHGIVGSITWDGGVLHGIGWSGDGGDGSETGLVTMKGKTLTIGIGASLTLDYRL